MKLFEETDTSVRCVLCPHRCVLSEGKTGICQVRKNEQNEISLPYYGLLSGTSIDPIEKKPLYHFYPGKPIFSVGFYGCNLSCPFCQNYRISQQAIDGANTVSPRELVDRALSQQSFGIAYTYSEPLVHFEYVYEASALAAKAGLKNVLVTNGFINKAPADHLLDVTDAANVDLKSFQDGFYKKELKGKLQPVLDFITMAAERIHLEVTTLVIPGKNDSESEIQSIASFISNISPSIPLHLSCYYPTYKYDVPATSADSVMHLSHIARDYLHYVYLGNVGTKETSTHCPNCNNLLIERRGYVVRQHGLQEGKCSNCGAAIPIVDG